jgi:hypothetical protein
LFLNTESKFGSFSLIVAGASFLFKCCAVHPFFSSVVGSSMPSHLGRCSSIYLLNELQLDETVVADGIGIEKTTFHT